jgi:uncharacterized protein YdhG (YjbR/CyaY superfamily)
MQYDAKTPAEYLKMLDDDWRKEKLLAFRKLLKTYAPELEESVQWKVLSYADSKGGLFALNAQKNYVSFYVGDAKKIDPDGSLLAGLNVGKGCIRFTKSKQLEDTRIAEFIAKAMAMRRRGEDFGCY